MLIANVIGSMKKSETNLSIIIEYDKDPKIQKYTNNNFKLFLDPVNHLKFNANNIPANIPNMGNPINVKEWISSAIPENE